MDAIGADHIGRLDNAAVLECRVGVSVMRADRNALLVEGDGVGLQRSHRIGEQAVQITPVQHEMRRAEALDAPVAEIKPVPCFAGAPVTQHPPFRPDLNLRERILQPQGKQNAGAVGADLDAGADFLQLVRLIVDLDIDAAPKQGQRRGQSADAAADDHDILRLIHTHSRWTWIALGGRPKLTDFSRRMPSPRRPSAEFPW